MKPVIEFFEDEDGYRVKKFESKFYRLLMRTPDDVIPDLLLENVKDLVINSTNPNETKEGILQKIKVISVSSIKAYVQMNPYKKHLYDLCIDKWKFEDIA